jgi:hypothetical protein
MTADKNLQEVRAYQLTLLQLLNNIPQGAVSCGCLSGSHRIPLGLGNGVATSDHEERRVDIIPQKEPYFLPPGRRIRH